MALDTATLTVDALSMGAEWENAGGVFATFANSSEGELMPGDGTTRTADVQSAETYLAAKWR